MVSTSEGIAIGEISVYVPVLLLAIVVVVRHGFQKQLGWIYLCIFCAIRIAGAYFKIESNHNPDNKTDAEWAAILSAVGLSPLLMASMGLLKRITDEVSNHARSDPSGNVAFGGGGLIGKLVTKRATANSRRSRIIQIAQLPTMIALILSIIGGTDAASSNPSDVKNGPKYTKIGSVIFICIYLLLVLLVVITIRDVGNAPRGEKRIYFVVLLAIPLLGVRLLWSVLSAFTHNKDFSVVSGKPWIQLFMAVIEELIIVVMYTLAGLTTPK